ncbi:MAG: hypothetical protein JXA18_13750 [Chitinispirillaceae bacterium]|nr:hypothetical protein [Chitinispirillaceae bacterium]
MKSLLTINFVFICFFSGVSENIEFNPPAMDGMNNIEKNKTGICDEIEKNLKEGIVINDFNFSFLVKNIRSVFDSVVIDAKDNRILFSAKEYSNNGIESYSQDIFTGLAYDFIDNIPSPISVAEKINILYVKHARSIHQERDEDGEIEDDVHLRTHLTVIKFGRMLHNLPVFNSYATVGFNVESMDINFIDLKNWLPINIEPVENFKDKIDKNKIEQAIRNKVQKRLDSNKQYKKVTIEEVQLGWQIIDGKNVTPAVIFHGEVFKEETMENGEKISSLEIL